MAFIYELFGRFQVELSDVCIPEAHGVAFELAGRAEDGHFAKAEDVDYVPQEALFGFVPNTIIYIVIFE